MFMSINCICLNKDKKTWTCCDTFKITFSVRQSIWQFRSILQFIGRWAPKAAPRSICFRFLLKRWQTNVVTCSKREGCGKVVLNSKEFSINVWEFLIISLFGSSYTSSLTSYVRPDTLVTSPGFGLIPNFEKADWLFGDKHFIFDSLMAYKMTKW